MMITKERSTYALIACVGFQLCDFKNFCALFLSICVTWVKSAIALFCAESGIVVVRERVGGRR